MTSKVDARLLKSTKFPPEFSKKVDMQKVNLQVMKKWIANRISDILGNEDDVVIELCFNLIEGSRHPDIKSLQIQLTGFLDKDTAPFCKDLWNLLLSAQDSPQGVPKELLEAKKLELMQEKVRTEDDEDNIILHTAHLELIVEQRDADRAADNARKQRQDVDRRDLEVSDLKQRDRRDRANNRADTWQGRRGNDAFDSRPRRGDQDRPVRSNRPSETQSRGSRDSYGRDIYIPDTRRSRDHDRRRRLLPAEEPLLQGTVGRGEGRGHPAEMPTVRGTNGVIIEIVTLGLLVSLDLCPPVAVRQRKKGEGGLSRAVVRHLAIDGGHHLSHPQALAVDQGHVAVTEGRPQEESTNVATVTRPLAPIIHEIGEAKIAEELKTRMSGQEQEEKTALPNHPVARGVQQPRTRGSYTAILSHSDFAPVRMANNRMMSGLGPLPTLAEYKETQTRVRDLIEKRRAIEKRLNQVEESIVSKEAAYLESTPSGNIITGFDNYMKGTTGAAAHRRKSGPVDQNRVFSKSSISYRPVNG
ncbi:hypothetical protein E4U55_007246, partial [Claviceps digitariae]